MLRHCMLLETNIFFIEYQELDTDKTPEEVKQTFTCNDFKIMNLTQNRYLLASLENYMQYSGYSFSVRKGYGSNLNCSWTILQTPEAGKRVAVQVRIFGLVKNDILRIYLGNYSNNVLLGEYTNTFLPYGRGAVSYRFYSDTWNNTVTFTSDFKNSGAGFDLLFYKVKVVK